MKVEMVNHWGHGHAILLGMEWYGTWDYGLTRQPTVELTLLNFGLVLRFGKVRPVGYGTKELTEELPLQGPRIPF
jgi:hypothetical protein